MKNWFDLGVGPKSSGTADGVSAEVARLCGELFDVVETHSNLF